MCNLQHTHTFTSIVLRNTDESDQKTYLIPLCVCVSVCSQNRTHTHTKNPKYIQVKVHVVWLNTYNKL